MQSNYKKMRLPNFFSFFSLNDLFFNISDKNQKTIQKLYDYLISKKIIKWINIFIFLNVINIEKIMNIFNNYLSTKKEVSYKKIILIKNE